MLALDDAAGHPVDALDFPPIVLGDGASLRKGQIVLSLGNPYGIAADGQANACWGIVSNLARKAPPVPDELDVSGKPTIHHFGTLIQTDAKLNWGTSGGALLNLRGEMVGLVTSLPMTPGYEERPATRFRWTLLSDVFWGAQDRKGSRIRFFGNRTQESGDG